MKLLHGRRGRSALVIGIAVVGLCSVVATAAPGSVASADPWQWVGQSSAKRQQLRFAADGRFKIVQFTDTQDDQDIDPRTVRLIETVIADQKPQLVVFTGDNISSGPTTPEEVKRAIDNIVRPVENSRTPWLVTFGNHDEDHTAVTGVDRRAMLSMYMSYPHNVNQNGPAGVHGTGNMQTLVYPARGWNPIFNVWALDSGSYASDTIDGQVVADDLLLGWPSMPHWDWIRPSQIDWYTETSMGLEKTYGKQIPSLMFFHIPLQEFRTMYEADAAKRAHPEMGLAPQHDVNGERNEDECPGAVNSGLFSALLERGDVKGVFVGHDHVNDYVGDYFGITLGYSANTGFGTYGLRGSQNDRMRGARVFVINENAPERFETKMVFAKDYGIH